MPDQLRLGLAGLRRCAGFLGAVRALADTYNVRVEAICDPHEALLEQRRQEWGVEKAFCAYEPMLEQVDAVILGTPMQCHAPQALLALDRHRHVLSEVTAAVTLDECRWLLQAAQRSQAMYMMAENYLYLKPNVLVKALAEAGLFGELYFAEGEYVHEIRDMHHDAEGRPTWRYYWQVGKRGCTYCTHSLAPCLKWLGERVDTVACFGAGQRTDPEHPNDDTTLMLCRTGQGKLVKIRLDMLSNRPHNMTYYSLQGTRGCYEAPRGMGDDHKVWFADRCADKNEWRPLWEFEQEFLPGWYRESEAEAKAAGHGGGDFFVVKDFLRAIREYREPPINIYDALDWTATGLVSEQSIAEGGRPLPVPDWRAHKGGEPQH